MMHGFPDELLDNGPCGYLCLLADGRVTALNATLLGWLGYPRGELVGKLRFQDLLKPGVRFVYDTHFLARLLADGRLEQVAFDLRTRDGSMLPVFVSAVLGRDELGAPHQVLMAVFNAGLRRRHERELLDAKRQAELATSTLEHCVAERTCELADALHRAQAAANTKNAFLANMSHEIRTPLNGILGMSHLALELSPPDPLRSYLETIRHAGQQVLNIVGDILDFSKIDAGELRLESLPLDIGALVQRVASQYAPLAAAKGLVLDVHCDPALAAEVLGDALRLQQVLANYVSNAVKFTETGRVILWAMPAGGDEDGMLVRFEVRDTGPGIAPDQQADLFKPFHQGDSSITRRHGGTGLGLAIARQLAELMHGRVGMRSRPGKGSLFWFEVRLPRAAGAALVATPEQPAPAAGARNRARLAGARILLAEDNPLNQELTRLLLEGCGATLVVAGDGQQALAALAAGQFDCLLMDIQMPVMDGYSATRALRQDPRHVHLPVIAMTANVFGKDREAGAASGMNDFIAKPIEPEAFYATLARWCDPGGDGAPAAAPAAAQGTRQGQLVNLGPLAELVDNDPDTMRHLLDIFLDNTGATLDAMGAALARGAQRELGPLAHRLKSSARAVGAHAVADLCESIEAAAAEAPSYAASLVPRLAALLPAVRAELAALPELAAH